MTGLIPSLRLGVVVLTNQDGHMLQEALKWQIFDAFIGKKAPDYVQAIAERRRQKEAERAAAALATPDKAPSSTALAVSMHAMVGVYESEVYGKAIIEQQNGAYLLRLEHHPHLVGTLTPAHASGLTCTYNHPMFGATVLPVNIENNQVKGFTLFVDAFVEADGYPFSKVQ